MPDPAVLLARQPIFDRQRQVVAYELLFRPIGEMVMGDIDGDAATSQVVLNAFTEIGLSKVTDNTQAFINYTENWLLDPPDLDSRVVVEVLEDVPMTEPIFEQLRALKAQGMRIALDDFIKMDAQYHPALEIADIVKVDLLAVEKEDLAELVSQLKGFDVQLVAEKVETHEEFKICMDLGFDLFQGYFLCRPENIAGKKIDSNKLVVARLLGELQDPEVDFDTLHNLISQDPGLSYKLMRIINSPLYYRDKPIESLRHALSILGLKQIKSWASIISLAKLNDKPHALLVISLQRAKMCELIACAVELGTDELMFTIGLFSTLDAFLDRDLESILEDLPLDDKARRALLRHQEVEGEILKTVKYHQRGDWSQIDWDILLESEITPSIVEVCYAESLQWAQVSFNALLD